MLIGQHACDANQVKGILVEPVQARPAADAALAAAYVPPEGAAYQAPADVYTGPSPAASPAWEPTMAHARLLTELKRGDWPASRVIGARIRTFPFPLKRLLGAGSSITQAEFRGVLDGATFTSLDGQRLRPRRRLPTGLGIAGKWYFVKAPWGSRVYAFCDKLWRSTAKADAQRWAERLASSDREPQSAAPMPHKKPITTHRGCHQPAMRGFASM